MRFRLVSMALVAGLMVAGSVLAEEKKETKTIIIKDGQVMRFEGDNGKTVVVGPGGQWHQMGDMVSRGYLGVTLVELTPELREHFKVPEGRGVMVSSVSKDSPAQKAGIRAGDVITGVDGDGVATAFDVSKRVREHKEGDSLKVELYRNGARQQVFATVAERKRPEIDFNMIGEVDPAIIEPKIREALEKVDGFFESPEWEAKVEAWEDCSKVQERLREMETRLKELEKKLAK